MLDKKQLEDAAKEITAKLGKVDILINGAGGNKKEATTSDSYAVFRFACRGDYAGFLI